VMTETLDVVNTAVEEALPDEELELARDLVRQAREQGASMSAPGLMRALTRSVLETALSSWVGCGFVGRLMRWCEGWAMRWWVWWCR
jgi:hypothetical protein